jgi:Insertion element 4 transposase N-terminal/Transposase DDE domain
MARTKAVLGSAARLTDFLGTSLLARIYPADLIAQLLDAHQCNSQRLRDFPATAVVYYTMSLSLYPEAAYGPVFDAVAQGLAWRDKQDAPATLKAPSISVARSRLPWQMFKDLQERSCQPMANLSTCPDAFYQGLRLMAMDGSNFEIPDEPDNVTAFGRPGSRTGVAGYPQAQCAILVECATHAIVGANIGAYRDAEWTVCKPLLGRMDSSMLCLADRGFDAYAYWCSARATGAQLLWRCDSNRKLPVLQGLPDGSFISEIRPGRVLARDKTCVPVRVRVIEYSLEGDKNTQMQAGAAGTDTATRYRLLSTLLDPVQAPGLELAKLYHQRWEVEGVFDELKTHLRQSKRVFRSKTPDLVRQEFYGWVMAHYAVRWLMAGAAAKHSKTPRELSFVANTHLLRSAQPQSGAFPPGEAKAA